MIRVLLRLAFGCRHAELVMERRELHGLKVMHFCCSCGYAVPVIERTPAEYRAGLAQQVALPRARKVSQPSAAERARVLQAVRPFTRLGAAAIARRAKG